VGRFNEDGGIDKVVGRRMMRTAITSANDNSSFLGISDRQSHDDMIHYEAAILSNGNALHSDKRFTNGPHTGLRNHDTSIAALYRKAPMISL